MALIDIKRARGGGRASAKPAKPSKHPRKGRRYSPGERKQILDWAAEHGKAAAADKFGCSAWTIRRWEKQAGKPESKKGKGRSTKDKTPAPPSQDGEHELSPEQQDRHDLVLEVWRTNPGFGPSQVRNQLKRIGYKISVHAARDIMEDHGYIQPRFKPKEPPRRFETSRPMQLYHFDFLHLYVHKLRQCLLLIEDDYSRFIAGWALLGSEHADGVIEALASAITRYGRPDGVMVDRASCFYSFKGVARFEKFVTEDNIDYFPIKEARQNGKLERLNATVRKELLTQQEFADLDDAKLRIAVWVHRYNYVRTHMALRGGMLVPADRFHGMEQDVLRRLEQGNGASPMDVLTPSGRGLELLRICTVAGRPAVYLLGEKVLG